MAISATVATAKGVVGYGSNMEEWNAKTKCSAVAGIGFGQPVIRSTAVADGIAPFAGTGVVIGVTEAVNYVDALVGYKQGTRVPVRDEGQMWVAAGGACTEGNQAFYNNATGGWGNAGGAAVPGVVFDSSAVAGEVVRIQIFTRAAVAAPVTP